jgi:hypothetical protein
MEASSATGKYLVGKVYSITKKQYKGILILPKRSGRIFFRKQLNLQQEANRFSSAWIFIRNPLMCSELLKELQKTMVDNIAYATSMTIRKLMQRMTLPNSPENRRRNMHNDRYTYQYPVTE